MTKRSEQSPAPDLKLKFTDDEIRAMTDEDIAALTIEQLAVINGVDVETMRIISDETEAWAIGREADMVLLEISFQNSSRSRSRLV
jgi:hypothetical protein